jgi:hypothetical protein
MPTTSPTRSREDQADQARALQESIAAQVEALRASDQWHRYLDFVASFHSYSLNNLLLILGQCPDASHVAGYRAWQAKGRQVRKGERALRIFGRSTKTIIEPDGATGDDKARTIVRYPMLSVFDISQTDPIEGAPDVSTVAHPLTGDDHTNVLAAVTTVLHRLGWTVSRQRIGSRANGYATTDGTRRVVLDTDLSPAQAAKTSLHEAAHVVLDHTDQPEEYPAHRGVMETEAESVAYVLAGLLGLDSGPYSIGYIAGWSHGDIDVIKSTAANVLRAVHELATALTGLADPSLSAAGPFNET